MYKKAIDIIASEGIDFRAIAIQIAKSNPSIFVKAANIVTDPRMQKTYPAFAGEETDSSTPIEWKMFHDANGNNFKNTICCNVFTYQKIVNKYGDKEWLASVLRYIFPVDDTPMQKIKAIKAVRASECIGLKESKWLVEDLMFGVFNRASV